MIIIPLIGVLALVIRLALIWGHKRQGCDAYYFLLSSEVYKKNRRLPIILPPIYKLEEQAQWYPPGFSIALSVIPRGFLDKYYWLLCPVLDCIMAMMTAGLAYVVTGNWVVTLVAGLCYAANTASMVDCTSLNSRILGLVLFAVTVLSSVGFALGQVYYIIPALLFGALMLLTHKSSSQLFYFLMIFMGIATMHWQYVVVLAGAVLVALSISNGFMIKVWKGQVDILSFWNKNWRNLGAHEIYGSPAYKGFADKNNPVHVSGWRGIWKSTSYLGINAFILPILWVAIHYIDLSMFDRAMLWWVIGTYLLGVMTQGIPAFRFAGEGYRYLKLAALPIGYLCAMPLFYGWDPVWVYYLLLSSSFLIGIYLVWRLFVHVSSSKTNSIPFMDTGVGEIIEYLKKDDSVRNILCIPTGVGDAVGYYTRKPVLRGTHNVPFSRVIPFFPVYKLPLEYLVKGYDVSHLVVMTSFVDTAVLGLSPEKKIIKSGEYELYDSKVLTNQLL